MASRQVDREALETACFQLPGEGRCARPGTGVNDALGLDLGKYAVGGGVRRRRELRHGQRQEGKHEHKANVSNG